jgi:putative ABC transport system permease protein
MRELITRFLDLFRRDKLEAELKDEIAFHKTMLERDERVAGASADDAAHAAHRQLGNITGVRERSRDAWGFISLDVLMQDLRYAFRGLRRSPGFTAAAVITLGLGIGANAAMFGVIDRLMFRPIPYLRDASAVHRVYLQSNTTAGRTTHVSTPYTRYLDLQKWTSSFSDFAAFSPTDLVVGTGEAAHEAHVVAASASFFGFFAAHPALGRFFTASEDSVPTGTKVAVLGYGYWQSHYGGRSPLGETLDLGYLQCTIIGVAPAGFAGIADGPASDIYIPITAYGFAGSGRAAHLYFVGYEWDWAEIMVRQKPGVSATVANADLTNALIRSRVAARVIHPNFVQVERTDPHAIAGSLRVASGPQPGLEARTLLWVTGVAIIVLLIACANVANLFLARALRRRREVALRLALGVSMRRLAAQSLTESLVLSMLGCAIGIAVAQWGGAALTRLFLPDYPAFSIASDWRTLGVAIAAAVIAGLLTGFAPILLAKQDDLAKTLKAGVREGTFVRSRLRSSLLVLQGALSVVLLVGAGLFVRSLGNVRDMRLGYVPNPVLEVTSDRGGGRGSDSAQAVVRARTLAIALAIPGVEHAAWVSTAPFEGSTTQALFVNGIDSVAKLGRFDSQTATTDYFATVGTRILRGRGFTSEDHAGAPGVMVVGEAMARVIWPGKNPIGECIRLALPGSANDPRFGLAGAPPDLIPCTTVVGVAEDVVHNPVADEPYRYYIPVEQFPQFGSSRLLLRLRDDPASSAEGIRRTLQKALPELSYLRVTPLRDGVDAQQRSWRIGATMFVAFGVLALIVAAVGLYGVIAYNVAQRMHELGVRVALGAQPGNIVVLVVGQAMRFALAGIALGAVLALVASRWLQPLLFHQSAKDPIVYAVVAVTLLIVAVAASTSPALRASNADPNTALRSD